MWIKPRLSGLSSHADCAAPRPRPISRAGGRLKGGGHGRHLKFGTLLDLNSSKPAHHTEGAVNLVARISIKYDLNWVPNCKFIKLHKQPGERDNPRGQSPWFE